MQLKVFLSVILFAGASHAGFFTTSETSAQTALQKIEELLPAKMKEKIGSLEVRFKNLGSEKYSGFTKDNKKIITVNSQYLKFANDSMDRSNLLFATVIHETMHQYDYQEKLSEELYFNLIAGVEKEVVTFSARTMDAYELNSGKENIAVNLEGFLLDPEFQCRRPTMYAYFRSRLQHTPSLSASCESQSVKLVKSDGAKIEMVDVDPSRVYQVHYLFASKGKAAMSRWGHAMIRLIVCDPKRYTVGPACMADINSHLTLSFQAIVNGIKLDTMDGIRGEYPSRLNVTSVFASSRQYNMGEQRDVISMPLKMSREQINRLVRRASEYQWSYTGFYKFFTNNCADETLKLLKIGFLNDQIAHLKIATPSSLFQKLLDLGLAEDMSLQLSEAQMIEQGYLFKSYAAKFETSLSVAKANIPAIGGLRNSDDYFKLTAAQRNIFVQQAIALPNESRPRTIAALVLLESGANMVVASEAQKRALKVLTRAEKKHDATRAEELQFFDQIKRRHLDYATAISNTYLMAKDGYGLPKESEIIPQQLELGSDEMKALSEEGLKVVAEVLGESFTAEYQAQTLNMETLLKNLRGMNLLGEGN